MQSLVSKKKKIEAAGNFPFAPINFDYFACSFIFFAYTQINIPQNILAIYLRLTVQFQHQIQNSPFILAYTQYIIQLISIHTLNEQFPHSNALYYTFTAIKFIRSAQVHISTMDRGPVLTWKWTSTNLHSYSHFDQISNKLPLKCASFSVYKNFKWLTKNLQFFAFKSDLITMLDVQV